MYYVYILRSKKTNKYYIGQTESLDGRLHRHNSGQVRSTKSGAPWERIYSEAHGTRQEACQRELEIKRWKTGIKFKKLIGIWEE